ncbi:MAG TPA: glycosyl hydrolase family 18 protein [Roseiflexaceae bacterium]|nr:glycosyl hydrolase family 18 protein [Roseiflexaceae bacterium]
MRRLRPTLRKAVLGLIYTTALVVWVALVADTAGLAKQATEPPRFPSATPPAPTATPRPPQIVAAPTVQVLQDIEPAIPDQRLASFHPKTGRYISAWLPDSFSSTNRASFEANADILDEVSPFWYATNSRGDLLHGSDARDQTLVELAHSKNVLVIPTVHNVQTTDPVPALLRNPERRARHIQNIVDEVLTHNYDGFDIDYEMMDSSLRDEYSAFIVDLGVALHAQGKLLTIAVHAKTSDYGGLGGFQDWAVLGQAVDRLRIMTYDYHWRGGGPGPVAPIYWVRQVAEYAKSVVDPAKVVIGVPFYGYNWPRGGGNASAQTWDAIDSLIQTYGLTVNLAESNANGPIQENWISYSGRTVWFATSRSLDAKLDLVQQFDLAGIAIWRLGGEDPRNWEVIRSRLLEDPFESQRMVNQVLPEH